MPETHAPTLDNALVRPDRVIPRGGFVNWADLSSITTPVPPLNVCGVQTVPGSLRLAIGRKAASSTAFVDPWFAPIVRPSASSALAAPTADLAVAFGSTTFTNNATAANLIPGPRGINFEGARLYISYGTSGSPVLDASGTFYGQSTNVCALSSAGTPSAYTNAPTGAIDIKGYQSRIWLLGGISSLGTGAAFGTGTFNPITIYFSNPLTPGGGNSASFADWKDPVTGNINYITMDGDTSDPGVGLATIRNGLLIFRYGSVWLLKGSTTANYILVPVSRDVGCIDPRSIVETDQGVYFMSRRGLMITNGVSIKNVSAAATHTLQSATELFTAAVKSSFGGYCTAAVTSAGQIVVSIGVAAVTSGAPDGHIQPVWCGMYDPAFNAWTRITSQLFVADGTIVQSNNNYPGQVFQTLDRRMLSIGDKYITQWEAETAATSLSPLTSANYAGTATQTSTGAFTWSGLSAATGAPDGTCANCTISGVGNCEKVSVTNYGFSIPAAATITGVSVQTIGFEGSVFVFTNSLQLLKAGVAAGSAKSDLTHAWGGSLAAQPTAAPTWGSSSDLWGTTLTPADVNNSGFGVALQLTSTHSGANNAGLDAISITVYYTISSVTQQQSFVKTPALYDTDPAGHFQPIPFLWKTRFVPVVGTTTLMRKFGQVKRWFCDYIFQGVSLPSTNGWTVTPVNSSGTTITGGSPVPLAPLNSSLVSSSISGGQQIAAVAIERVSQDMYSEISDMSFTIAFNDAQQSTAPSGVVAELYGVGIEYQPARDLR